MKIELREITEFPAEFSQKIDSSDLAADFSETPLVNGVQLDVTIHKTDEEYLLNGVCSAEVEFECARCLEPAHIILSGDISVIAVQPGAEHPDKFSGEDDVVQLNEKEELSLDEQIRQAIASDIPMKPLCREDCKGLCPKCGVNRNTTQCDCDTRPADSRWDGLRDIVNKKE